MSKVVLFLLGEKGYQVARAALSTKYLEIIKLVVIGEDPNVQNDYSDLIQSFCEKKDVSYCFRRDFISPSESCESTLAIVAGWRWLIVDNYKSIIVFHDSLLPKYRGFNPLVTALLNRDEYAGVTAIMANRDFDRGDVITSQSIRIRYPIMISKAITLVSELYYQIAEEIFSCLKNGIPLKPKPQNDNEASYSVWRDEEDYRINWNWSAEYIAHFVNCMGYPYKGASTTIDGELIRILEVEHFGDVNIANRDVGKILFVEESKPVVICGVGLIKLNKVFNEKDQNVLPFKRFRVRLK